MMHARAVPIWWSFVAVSVVVLGVAVAMGSQIEEAEAGGSFTVGSMADLVDDVPDGVCKSADLIIFFPMTPPTVVPGVCTLRAAIEEANALPGPAVVTLPAGTYKLTLGRLRVEPGGGKVTIHGAGAGSSVIDAGGNSRVFVVPSGGELELSGVAVRNGDTQSTNDSGSHVSGGGIVNGGTLTVSDSVIEMSRADRGGGLTNRGTATLTRTVVQGNVAADDGSGGGIHSTGLNSSLTLVDSVVSGNMATGGGTEVGGGGLQVQSGAVMLIRTTVSGNSTNGRGGGLDVFQGITQQAPTVTIAESTVSGNSATGPGGGIFVTEASVSLTNVTVSGNSTTTGGGGVVAAPGATVSLTNTTIAGNSGAPGMAGGVDHLARTMTLQNTIVASNPPLDCVGGVTSFGNNLDSDGTCNLGAGGDLPGAEAMLGPLQDNGGLTETHALLAGSEAIDAGDDLFAPVSDQRGEPRIGPSDMGAFEFQGVVGVDGDGDGFDSVATGGTDCDDVDPTVFPGAAEMAYDGVDQDCDGSALDDEDGDGSASDMATGGSPDCDDTDDTVFPGAPEVKGDGVDQDCDGEDAMEEEEEPKKESMKGEAQLIELDGGGQFWFWQFGPTEAAAIFTVLKIAWLWDPAAFSWVSFVPALGVTNFLVEAGDFLWVVSEGPQTIVVGEGVVGEGVVGG